MTRRSVRYGVSLLLLQLAFACTDKSPTQEPARENANAAAPAAQATPATEAKLVLAFGDSLYAGYNLEPSQGFAPALERALAARGLRATVVNGGVSGDTTGAALQRLSFTLDGLARKPDLVIVGLGGNDMLRGLSPAATRANLHAIVKQIDARGIPVILTGMIAAPNMGPDYAAAFNPIYGDLAKEYGAPLYPFFLEGVIGAQGLMLPDGIHPNDRGVQAIVERIAPMVEGKLRE